MPRQRAPGLLAAAASLVLLVAGCAGDDAGGVAETADAGGGTDGGGWELVTDDASGARFELPAPSESHEDTAAVADGTEVSLRNYAAVTPDQAVEVGLNVLDVPGGSYDLEAGVAGVADTLAADVVSAVPIEVDGNPAVEVELSYGDDMFVLFQLITTDEHVLQTLASGPESERAAVEATFQQLNDSLEAD